MAPKEAVPSRDVTTAMGNGGVMCKNRTLYQ